MDEMNLVKPIKLITDSDLDGKSCAVLGKLFYGKDIDITYTNPIGIKNVLDDFIGSDKFLEYNKIYITDLNIKEFSADMINEVNSPEHQFILIDHHESSLYLKDKYDWAIVEVEKVMHKTCATQLFYLYLSSKHIADYEESVHLPYYVSLVRLWDTWDWQKVDPKVGMEAKNMNMLCGLYNTNKFVSTTYIKLKENRPLFTHAENELISIFTNNINKYCKQKLKALKHIEYNGITLGVVFAEDYVSDLGDLICSENPDVDVAFMICPNMNIVSMRTKKDNINLATIAEHFGGGGHAKAAGFPYNSFSNRKLIDSILYDKE